MKSEWMLENANALNEIWNETIFYCKLEPNVNSLSFYLSWACFFDVLKSDLGDGVRRNAKFNFFMVRWLLNIKMNSRDENGAHTRTHI